MYDQYPEEIEYAGVTITADNTSGDGFSEGVAYNRRRTFTTFPALPRVISCHSATVARPYP